MPRLSDKSLLAIAAVVDVALHARGTPVAAKALAARHNLPPRHLEPVLQALVHAGVLKGVRGPRGGYELARERRRISVAEVARVVEAEGEDALDDFPSLVREVVQPAVAEAERTFEAALEGVTIEELCRTASRKAAEDGRRTSAEGIDFTI
ncbi:MAG TPA: Rrf2 family transcriptional regulator [Xanthobacteraceae bacterium]|nr:Rrf2 family transcriptional regulator [Xanthobacteraceae bacterium]